MVKTKLETIEKLGNICRYLSTGYFVYRAELMSSGIEISGFHDPEMVEHRRGLSQIISWQEIHHTHDLIGSLRSILSNITHDIGDWDSHKYLIENEIFSQDIEPSGL